MKMVHLLEAGKGFKPLTFRFLHQSDATTCAKTEAFDSNLKLI